MSSARARAAPAPEAAAGTAAALKLPVLRKRLREWTRDAVGPVDELIAQLERCRGARCAESGGRDAA